MGIQVGETIAALDLLGSNVDEGLYLAVKAVAEDFKTAGMEEAPVGVPGNSTAPPGELKRSFEVEGPVGGADTYAAMVGPTTVYARQREMGGDIYPQSANALAFVKFGTLYVVPSVHQDADPYLARAYVQTLPTVEDTVEEYITGAIVSTA